MARIPRLVSGAPSISLTADEIALLDAIDGVRDEEELARHTDQSVEAVADHLERLALLGTVTFDQPVRAEVIDLDPTTRRHLDRIHELLAEADYYELLGIARDADKGAVKGAYHRLGPAFHPDRHFRKRLGPYKQKIEAVFAAVTRAHDTLRYPKRRQEYDAQRPERPGSNERREAIRAAVDGLAPPERKTQESSPTLPPPGSSVAPPPPPPRGPLSSHPVIVEGTTPRPSGSDPPRRRSLPGIPLTHLEPDQAVDGSYRRATPPAMRSSSSPPTSPDTAARRLDGARVEPLSTPPPERRSDPGSPKLPPRSDPEPWRPRAEDPERKDALARKLRARAGAAVEVPPPEAQSRQRPAGTYQAATDVRKSAAEVVRDRFQTLGDEVRRRRLHRYLEQGRVAMAAGDFRAASAAYQQAQKLAPDDADIAQKTAEALRLALEKL